MTRLKACAVIVTVLAIVGCAARDSAPAALVSEGVSLPTAAYGHGRDAVILVAHGGYSTLESWAPDATWLADAGFRVLVIETRGAVALRGGRETDCLYDAPCMAQDVLAAVRLVTAGGARSVSVIGGSAGGGAAAQAALEAPGAIDRLVLLAPMTIDAPERVAGRKLVAVARGDLGSGDVPRLPAIQQQYDRMPEPKEFLLLDGAAHGQRMLTTDQAPALRQAILSFLRKS